MNTQQLARTLMMGYHHALKNRQKSMLGRIGAEIGMNIYKSAYGKTIPGTPHPTFGKSNAL